MYYSSGSGAYRVAFDSLVRFGDDVEVRGRQTRELLNYTTQIANPSYRVINVPGRHWNPFIAMSEILWFFSGRNDIAPLVPFNSRIGEFSDDGVTLNGSAYGYRLKDQIEDVIGRLRQDPNDRRAVLAIWDKADLMADTKDPPCNDMIMVKVRKGQLHLTVLNRSNDIHWGLYAVNYPVFSSLQDYLAECLHVKIGSYVHFSNSLHYYTDNKQAVAITERMKAADVRLIKPQLPDAPLFARDLVLPFVAEKASEALAYPIKDERLPFFMFASQALEICRQHEPWRDIVHKFRYSAWDAACEGWLSDNKV